MKTQKLLQTNRSGWSILTVILLLLGSTSCCPGKTAAGEPTAATTPTNTYTLTPTNPVTALPPTISPLPTAKIAPRAWVSHGPYGANITALAVDPTAPAILYAGSFRGLFKSTDAGENWHRVSGGLTNIAMNTSDNDQVTTSIISLAVDPVTPATVYAGTMVPGCYSKARTAVRIGRGSTRARLATSLP